VLTKSELDVKKYFHLFFFGVNWIFPYKFHPMTIRTIFLLLVVVFALQGEPIHNVNQKLVFGRAGIAPVIQQGSASAAPSAGENIGAPALPNSQFLNSVVYISFESASFDQVEYLTDLALRSNGIYQYRTVTDEEARSVFTVELRHLTDGVVRLMKDRGSIVGFYGLCDHQLSHLFLEPEYIGKGYGKLLFSEAMRTAKEELKWPTITWESDPNAAWFYRKMGAIQVGENECPLNPSYKAPVFRYDFAVFEVASIEEKDSLVQFAIASNDIHNVNQKLVFDSRCVYIWFCFITHHLK
jgi:GNAT superfamily N-acetyltransferase